MKPFKFACPACGKNYAIRKLEQVGRKMRCTGCDAASTIARAPAGPTAGEAPSLGRDFVGQLSELTGLLESASAELSNFSAAYGTDAPGGGAAVAAASPPAVTTAPIAPVISDSLEAIDTLLKDMPGLAVREAIAAEMPAVTAEEIPTAEVARPAAKPTLEQLMAQLLSEAEPLPAVSAKPASAPKSQTKRPAGPAKPEPEKSALPAGIDSAAAVRQRYMRRATNLVPPPAKAGRPAGPAPARSPAPVQAYAKPRNTALPPMATLADDDVDFGETMAADPVSGDTISDTIDMEALSPLEELGEATAARVSARSEGRRTWMVAGMLGAVALTVGATVAIVILLGGDAAADVAAAVRP